MKTLLLLILFSISVQADHYVEGYIKQDGTYVQGHVKTDPNSTTYDNYSNKLPKKY